jgi:hypothetical protein
MALEVISVLMIVQWPNPRVRFILLFFPIFRHFRRNALEAFDALASSHAN